jgi:hypothetical protein
MEASMVLFDVQADGSHASHFVLQSDLRVPTYPTMKRMRLIRLHNDIVFPRPITIVDSQADK